MIALLFAAVALADVKPSMLVEPRDAIGATSLVIDVRSAKKFEEGHLPGAINVRTGDWSEAVTAGTTTPAFWAKALGDAGIDVVKHKTIICSGDDMRDVCRAWWLLRFAGLEDVRVYNGRVEVGQNLVKGPAAITPSTNAEWKLQASRQVHKEDVHARAKGELKDTVIDGRSTAEFKDGHVPKAKHLEWSELIDDKSGSFRSLEELKKLFASRGIDPSESPLCYCQSGGRASVVAFALELVSGKPARNYYRSWSEWSKDANLPREK